MLLLSLFLLSLLVSVISVIVSGIVFVPLQWVTGMRDVKLRCYQGAMVRDVYPETPHSCVSALAGFKSETGFKPLLGSDSSL